MMRAAHMGRSPRLWHALSLGAAVLAFSAAAAGAVRREGVWPSADKTVTLEARGMTRAQAIQKLADAAGWSIVVHAPPGDPVDLHIKAQPASRVLEMLLTDGDYVANRSGDLISVTRDSKTSPLASGAPAPKSSAAPLVPAPAAVPAIAASAQPVDATAPADPSEPAPDEPSSEPDRGEDRVITGGSFKIAQGETVHDVMMLGGSVEVFGNVTGDVVVTGGSVHLFDGSHVHGDVTALGGAIDVDDGALVDGDVGVVGGSLHKAEGAKIGGDIKKVGHGGKGNVHVNVSKSSEHLRLGRGSSGLSIGRIASDIGAAITRSAMLFVFGAIFLALATRRMEALQTEVAARPMRSFALGVVGGLAATVLLVALCVTGIGIPVAVIGVLAATLGAFVGISSVLSTVGGALLGHRTKNPYLHLALGCALFLVIGAIPYLGGFVTAAVVLIGMGAVVATRGLGLFPTKPNGNGSHPYREAADSAR
ncbi:MAG: polymer-forming cytoskeletal protein [Deltaproteobacteria bacterium]|nr:polymer-forming cytoskeletal protein [Deltaproteobacteria bacterium]